MLEYAIHFVESAEWEVRHCAHMEGEWRLVPRPLVEGVVGLLRERWSGAGPRSLAARSLDWMSRRRRSWCRATRMACRPLAPSGVPDGPITYVNVSHKGLTGLGQLRGALFGRDLQVSVMIHDLMPITEPRWFPVALQDEFRAGVDAVRHEADLVIANSVATADSLARHWTAPATPTVLAAHLGVCLPQGSEPRRRVPPHPYFVFLGSLEERKNVEVLFDVWASFAGEAVKPVLILVSPPPADAALAKRIAALAPAVRLMPGLHDRAVADLLRGSRALVLPSRAEGFGLPVVEALSLGVPVICSDLPALREIAGDVPCIVPPDDRDAWTRAVRDFIDDSPARRLQVERANGLRFTTWSDHFDIVESALRSVTGRRSPVGRARPTESGSGLATES